MKEVNSEVEVLESGKMERDISIDGSYESICNLSARVRELQGKLERRNLVVESIRRAYYKDVIVIKEEIQSKSDKGASYHPSDQLACIPSVDLRDAIPLYAPAETYIRMRPCSECGGQVEIVHSESAELRVARENLATSLKGEKNSKRQIHSLRKQLEEEKELTYSLQQRSKLLEKENANLLEQLIGLRSKEREYKKNSADLQAIVGKLKTSRQELDISQATVLGLQSQYQLVSSANKTLVQTEERLETEIRTLRDHMDDEANAKKDLILKFETLSTFKAHLEENSTLLKTTISDLKKDLEFEKENVSLTKDSLQKYKDMSTSLQQQLERLSRRNQEAAEAEEAAQEKLKNRMSESKKRIKGLEKENSLKEKTLEEYEECTKIKKYEMLELQNSLKEVSIKNEAKIQELQEKLRLKETELEQFEMHGNELLCKHINALEQVYVLEGDLHTALKAIERANVDLISEGRNKIVVDRRILEQDSPMKKQLKQLLTNDKWNRHKIEKLEFQIRQMEKEINDLLKKQSELLIESAACESNGADSSSNAALEAVKNQINEAQTKMELQSQQIKNLYDSLKKVLNDFLKNCDSPPIKETLLNDSFGNAFEGWLLKADLIGKEIIHAHSLRKDIESDAKMKHEKLMSTLAALKESETECVMISGDLLNERRKHFSLIELQRKSSKESTELKRKLETTKEDAALLLRQRDALLKEKVKQKAQNRQLEMEIGQLKDEVMKMEKIALQLRKNIATIDEAKRHAINQANALIQAEHSRLETNKSVGISAIPTTKECNMQTDKWKHTDLVLLQRNSVVRLPQRYHKKPLVILSNLASRSFESSDFNRQENASNKGQSLTPLDSTGYQRSRRKS